MKFLISTVLVLQVIWVESTSALVSHSVEDYYWKDYNGTVPWDAVPGGTKNGKKTFIGQFNIPRGDKIDSVPAIITKGSPIGIAMYNDVIRSSSSDSNLRIMCSTEPLRYKWYSPTELVAPGCHYVIGGTEFDNTHYIGRAIIHSQMLVGKVSSNNSPLKLTAPTNNYDFEILSYCH